MKNQLLILLTLLSALAGHAQRSHNSPDPMTLDYETNLQIPVVPEKQYPDIKRHIDAIEEALKRLHLNTSRQRDKQVVTVTIPASELFAPNDTVLKESGRAKLQHFGKFLKYPTMYKLVIAVYTDNTGEPQYCDWLSETRANAIDDYLIDLGHQNGYPTINVVPYGMGQQDYKVENSTIDNRAANRRVEIHIIPEWQMIETARAGKLK